MNPWTSLLDPQSLIPKEQEAGRRHILAGEPDPETTELAGKPARPPQAAPVLANASIPLAVVQEQRESAGAAAPQPASGAAPAPRKPVATAAPAMTYAEAIKIRERHRARQPIDPAQVLLANRIVQETRRMARLPKADQS